MDAKDFRSLATDRLAGVEDRLKANHRKLNPLATDEQVEEATRAAVEAVTPDALVTVDPLDLVELAKLAAPNASADELTKVTDLANGAAAAHNGADSEVHLRATDVLFLCDLAEKTIAKASAKATSTAPSGAAQASPSKSS